LVILPLLPQLAREERDQLYSGVEQCAVFMRLIDDSSTCAAKIFTCISNRNSYRHRLLLTGRSAWARF